MTIKGMIASTLIYFGRLPKALIVYLHYVFSNQYESDVHNGNVVIDGRGLNTGRRLAQIVLQFVEAGYNVSVYKPFFSFLLEKSWIYEFADIAFSHISLFKKECLLTVCSPYNKHVRGKRIILNDYIDDFHKHINERMFYPILEHPKKYLGRDIIRELSDSIRYECIIGIIFIGSADESYDAHKDEIHNRYNIYTRNEILRYVMENYSNELIRPSSNEELKYFLHNIPLKNRIVVIDKFRLDGKEFMEVLRQSAFHLWTPGYIQPYCHNQVESLSCGCIPIYQKYTYYPGLNNEENAFEWNNFDELDSIIHFVLSDKFSEEKISMMRANAFRLWESNMSSKAFKQRISEFVNGNDEYLTYCICPKIIREKQ